MNSRRTLSRFYGILRDAGGEFLPLRYSHFSSGTFGSVVLTDFSRVLDFAPLKWLGMPMLARVYLPRHA
ncbi:MAG: hypothetical protein WCE90_08215 [Candidatus Zixiibacteriota bacterium]